MSTIVSTISKLETRIANLQTRLEVVGCMITSTPWIVCSEDGYFTVNVTNENYCQVQFNTDTPQMFDLATASLIARGFKAFNGNGPIKWIVLGEKEFMQMKIKDLSEVLDTLNELPLPASN